MQKPITIAIIILPYLLLQLYYIYIYIEKYPISIEFIWHFKNHPEWKQLCSTNFYNFQFYQDYLQYYFFIIYISIFTFLKILSLWASTYSCWTRWPFPLVGGVDLWRSWFTWFSYFWLLLLLLCGGVRLDEGSSRLKAEGGTHFLKKNHKKKTREIYTYIYYFFSFNT